MLYALSTCVWCMRTKEFLTNHNVEYSFIDVDLVPDDERDAVLEKQRSYNPKGSFPTLVVNDNHVIVGYDAAALKNLVESEF